MRKLLVLPLFLIVLPHRFTYAATADGSIEMAAQQEEVSVILAKQEIALPDLFRLAELTNLSLAAARSAVDIEAGRTRQAGLYPNPTFDVEVEELSTRTSEFRKDKVALVQPLILSGRRGAAVSAARANHASADYARQHTRREVFRRIHTLWAAQLYFHDAERAVDELLEVANRTLDIAQTRFDARAAPESHVTKALLEVYGLDVVRQQLTEERVQGTAELLSLFDGTQVPLDRLVGSLDRDPIDDASAHVDDHPALWAAKTNVDAAAATLRAVKAARVPDLGLFVAYGKVRPADEGFVEAGISIPLPLFDRNQGRVAESHALVAQANQHLRIVENDLDVTLAVTRQRYHTARELRDTALNRIVPAAERGLAQAQEGYRVGRLPFLELIDAQRTHASVRRQMLELKRALAAAEADLMSLVGVGPYGETGENQ